MPGEVSAAAELQPAFLSCAGKMKERPISLSSEAQKEPFGILCVASQV